MATRKKYDIISEATKVVDNQLALLEALYEAKDTQAKARSKLVCRCPACQAYRQSTLAWIETMRSSQPETEQPKAA